MDARDTESESTSWNWGRWGIVAFAAFWISLIAAMWSEGADAAQPPLHSPDDEYSFSWLDPDKKIYVLQNRRYLKAERLMLSGMAGIASSNPYRTTFSVDPRLSYYFKEWLGIEVFYGLFFTQENSTFAALKLASPTTLPTVREIRSQLGGLVHYVPWYAKINVFNQILYFDWYFSGGAGTLRADLDTRSRSADPPSYLKEDLFALYLGTGHQYHLSRELTVRLDFLSTFYRAKVFGDGRAGDEDAWYTNLTFGAGLGIRL